MASFRVNHLIPKLVGAAVACASLFIAAEPASAELALFRAKRTWWFSQAGSWTSGGVIPPSGMQSYQLPAVAQVGTTPNNPKFSAPKSFIKDTTYTFMCGPGTFQCYIGYPKSSGWSSYWNAKGYFRPQNPNAATTTTTIRVRTVYDGWPGPAAGPPTAMYTRVTPTEGGCTGLDCPGTTQFGGRYYASRGGSIMIEPGPNRFGGTMRFFSGPNARFYQLITISGPWTSVTFPPAPLSVQVPSSVEFEIGEVSANPSSRGYRYRLTEPNHVNRLITGMTPGGGACTQVTAPPNGTGMCAYYQKTAQYLVTRAPYTTGMIEAWQPNGNTNTIQTATGYDNRTAMGLNGTVSMVHPRLFHAYTMFPSSNPPKAVVMNWSSSRMRKIDFRFLPEPAGFAMLAAGFITLAGLYRLRRR